MRITLSDLVSLRLARLLVHTITVTWFLGSESEQVFNLGADTWYEIFSFLNEAFTLGLLSLVQLDKGLLLWDRHLNSRFQLASISRGDPCVVGVSKHTSHGVSMGLFILNSNLTFLSGGWLLLLSLIGLGLRLFDLIIDHWISRGECWRLFFLGKISKRHLYCETTDSSIVERVNSGISCVLEHLTNFLSVGFLL